MMVPEETSPLISAKDISLEIPIFRSNQKKISTNILKILGGIYTNQNKTEKRTLVRDVNFDLYPGERIGLIGRNGAGKTTLLRVLCGIYQHTGGELSVRGNIHGLFTVSLGMNPRATGIENIYLRGLQMGLSVADIRDLVPEVIEFADIGLSIHDMFGNYSAGMRLRLSIAISTMIKPELLILDEWIGAGDESFKKKVQERMSEIVDSSKGMVIATHARGLMKNLCSHGLVMSEGKMMFYGKLDDAFNYYDETL